MSSFKETQEPPYTHISHYLEPKTVFQIFVIFLIIRGFPPTSRQTQWTEKIKNLVISESRGQWQKTQQPYSTHFLHCLASKTIFQKSVILLYVRLSETSKTKSFTSSESREECHGISGISGIYALLPLSRTKAIFPEICHFLDNLVHFSEITSNSVKLPNENLSI